MINIKIFNTDCRIVGALDSETVKILDKQCSYTHQSFSYMQSKRGSYKGWDGIIRLFRNGSFPIQSFAIATRTNFLKFLKYLIVLL